MQHRKIFTLILVATMIAVVGGLALTLRPSKPTTGRVQVVASAGFWGDIVKQIGGDHVDVVSILDDPEADPHLYETGAKDSSVITHADVVIINGLGYDDFMQKALATAPLPAREVVTVAEVLGKTDGDNPHIWYAIPDIHLAAAAFEQALSRKDPAHSADYKKNLGLFIDSLQPLTDRLTAIRAAHFSAPVAYTERLPAYLLQAAGLRVVSPERFAAAIESGTEPAPSDTAIMRDLIASNQIKVLLYNSQAENEAARSLRDVARQHGVPVVAVSETAPQGVRYQDWQRDILDALLAALNN